MLSALVRSSGLGAYLDATISVDGTKKVKPTPIATLSSRLGVKSGEVMFVSSNGFDVVGAKHFGLKVAWTPPDRCHHLSSFLPMRQPTVVTITVAIEYQVITKSELSSVQYAA
jgi:FMN phosphatase YigB (HAD superfamily)